MAEPAGNEASFQDQVVALAKTLFPDLSVKPHPDSPDVVIADGHLLSLQNIRATYQHASSPETALEALVRHHFGQLLSRSVPPVDELTWEEAQGKVYPQIMPVDYETSAPLPLITFPLSSEVKVGLVMDFPQTYMYLRHVELQRWGMDAYALYEAALSNLAEISRGVDVQMAGQDRDVFIAVATGDGYDAARILIPHFQELLADHLGETFRFAIPNRDFLIAWPLDCEDAFHAKIVTQVATDYSERPYPLSSSVFVRNVEGNIHEQKISGM